MSKEQPLWQTDSIILLRWIMFIPIGFILTATLQVIPSLVVGLVKVNMPESTLQTIIAALIAVPILIVLGWAWCMGVLMTPHFSCGFIAPSNRAPTVIYGMLFCLFEGTFLISILKGGISWISLVYQLIFLGITVGGIVMLHKEIKLSRFMRWTLPGKMRSLTTFQI